MTTNGATGIVVVGGGITGAFTAYFLSRAGIETTLIERDEIAGHASGSNPGGLNPLHGAGIPGPMQQVALDAFRLHEDNWGSIRELAGIDFSARRTARLHLAVDRQDVEQLERVRKPYDSTPGFTARWVERDELSTIEPGLDRAVERGLWTEGNARVDAATYTRAVARAASALGTAVVKGEVQGLRRHGGRVTGVDLRNGSIGCDGVVIASGPWCGEPARWLGIPIPVEPVKGELLLVAGRGMRADLAWRNAAVYGTAGGEAWLGGTEERVGFDATPSSRARAAILERVSHVVPKMRSPRVLRHVAALRPVTRDGIPIVGLAGNLDNACLAVGSGRKGVLLSAAIGRAAADLVTSGSTAVPIGACSAERWTTAAAEEVTTP
jgi:glycine oxidase